MHQFSGDGCESVVDIHCEPVAKQRVAAFFINGFALDIHHIVILQEPLTRTKVVFFHLLLRPFDAVGHHRMLNDVPFFVSHFVHQPCDAVALKQAHELIFQRDIEVGGTGVALTACTTAQLPVHPPALVPLGPDNGQTA